MPRVDFCDFIETIERDMNERHKRIEATVNSVDTSSLLQVIRDVEKESLVLIDVLTVRAKNSEFSRKYCPS